jgi:hypothetical protein
MKLRTIIPFAVAAVLALSTAVIGAGTAAAATPTLLCIRDTNTVPLCAQPEGSSPVIMCEVTRKSGPDCPIFKGWLYNGLNHPGQIQQNGTSLCMQLDHNAGNLVIEATCNGASYQKWAAFLAANGMWSYYSMWDPTQCLTFNADLAELDTVTCNGAWYQQFYPIGDAPFSLSPASAPVECRVVSGCEPAFAAVAP